MSSPILFLAVATASAAAEPVGQLSYLVEGATQLRFVGVMVMVGMGYVYLRTSRKKDAVYGAGLAIVAMISVGVVAFTAGPTDASTSSPTRLQALLLVGLMVATLANVAVRANVAVLVMSRGQARGVRR